MATQTVIVLLLQRAVENIRRYARTVAVAQIYCFLDISVSWYLTNGTFEREKGND